MSKKKNNDLLSVWSEKISTMLVLGFLCILCSLPIVTAGASITAMHKAMKLYVKYGEKRIFQAYFGAFIKYFKQSTLIWLLNLILLLTLCFDLLFYGGTQNWIQMIGMIVVTISLMIVIFEMTMSFVLIAEEMTTGIKDTILCALKYGLKCPYEALMMMLLNLALPGLLFLIMIPVLVFVPGVISYMCWQFLPKSLANYRKLMNM